MINLKLLLIRVNFNLKLLLNLRMGKVEASLVESTKGRSKRGSRSTTWSIEGYIQQGWERKGVKSYILGGFGFRVGANPYGQPDF